MSFLDLVPQPVTLPDGAVLHYVREGKGEPLIFVHGSIGDWRYWEAQWPVFTKAFDCIAISLRYSHPNTNRMPSPDHSALSDAADILAVMDALGLSTAHLLGTSYGAFAALGVATRAPERITSFVAVEPPMLKYAEMFEDTAPVVRAFRESTVAPARAAFERGDDMAAIETMTGGISETTMTALDDEVRRRRLQNLESAKRVSLSSDEFPLIPPEDIAGLTMPHLLVVGEKTGAIFRATYSGLTRVAKNAQTAQVPGGTHNLPVDSAAPFNEIALAFLTSTSQPSA